MMKAAAEWQTLDDGRTLRSRLNGSSSGTVLPEPKMGPVVVVIPQEFRDQPAEMVLVQSDHVVQKAASEGAVHPLHRSVLPGRTKSGDLPLDPEGGQERFLAGED